MLKIQHHLSVRLVTWQYRINIHNSRIIKIMIADTQKKNTEKGEHTHTHTLIGARITDMLIVGP